MFFASGSKNHRIYNVFWLVPSKNTCCYAVFSMLQEAFLPFTMFWRLARTKKTAKNPPKSAQNNLQKASCHFCFFFSDPGTRKT
jgi:hypothetical protein